MNRFRLGKGILSFTLVATTIVSAVVDLNRTHVFNPAWHPHAVFHDALMLLLLAGVTVISLWLLWRPSAEPQVAVKVASLVPVVFWTPFYYITFLLPNSSLNFNEPLPSVTVFTVYPNVIVGTVMLLLTGIGYRIASRAQPT